ncbi:MAG: glycosyltransferase [Acidobacteria bacterium]|nr:glycosyltransferase [Acidobacteriota bacterium]
MNDEEVALIVISDLEFGGAQRQVVELANHLAGVGIESQVCTLADYTPLAASLRHPERLHLVRRRGRYDLTVVPRLAALIRRVGAALVHGFLFDAEVASRVAGRLAGVPVIGSERNANYVVRRKNALAYRLTRPCVDLVIANSSAGADFHSRRFGVPRSSCRVVYNGVDTGRFRPCDGGTARDGLGLGREDQVVGMFASFKEQKDHPLLLLAARELLQSRPRLRLLLVGDELFAGGSDSRPWKQRIEGMVDTLGLRRHCVLAGNRDDVERLYPACDLTVLPSRFEGIPNVVLESMACGVPVVVTDVSDNARIVPDGRVGFVVPAGDRAALVARIQLLLDAPTRRREMAAEARRWAAAEFSVERLAERTAQIYREAIERRRRRRPAPRRRAAHG